MLVMTHDEHGYGAVDNHGDHDGYIGHPDDHQPGRPVGPRERESVRKQRQNRSGFCISAENYEGAFLNGSSLHVPSSPFVDTYETH